MNSSEPKNKYYFLPLLDSNDKIVYVTVIKVSPIGDVYIGTVINFTDMLFTIINAKKCIPDMDWARVDDPVFFYSVNESKLIYVGELD